MRRRGAIRMRLLLAAVAALLAAGAARADGDAARGEKRFEECATCHSTERGVNNVGPSLFGVLGRTAGEIADFRYSPAMRTSGITWSAQTLDKFIAMGLVPVYRIGPQTFRIDLDELDKAMQAYGSGVA